MSNSNNTGIAEAVQLDQLSKDSEFQTFQQGLGSFASSPEYSSSLQKNPSVWKELSKIPGVATALTNNPKLQQSTLSNPKKALNKLKKLEGNQPRAQVVVPDEVIPVEAKDPNQLGLEASVDLAPITAQIDRAQLDMDTSIASLEEANAPLLRGEIPADVQSQLRRVASERTQQSGVGGQASEARTARDFGLTSYQIMTGAMQTQAAIADARRLQVGALESRRQFEKSYQLQSRQFAEDMRRTDIQAKELDQLRRRFNAEQNLNLIKLVSEVALARAQIKQAYDAAETPGGAATVAPLDSLTTQIDKIIGRPGKVT